MSKTIDALKARLGGEAEQSIHRILWSRATAALKTQSEGEPIKDKELFDWYYKYWRIRVMYSMIIGYAVFYFVRKNFSIINVELSNEYGFTTTDIGLIFSVGTIVYALFKFLGGMLADKMNPRYLMGLGLLISAAINVFCGFTEALAFFALFWGLNSIFQGVGVPSCSRLLTNWFTPSESGRAWGIWNASHQIGGALIIVLAAYLVEGFGWRSAFFVPAAIAMVVAFFLLNRLRDNPSRLGLPDIQVYKKDISVEAGKKYARERKELSFIEIFKKYILFNRMIWVVCFANFFVYIVRMGVLYWGPRFLKESKGMSTIDSGWTTAVFEITGIFGALFGGMASDKIFKGRRGPVSTVFMLCLIVSTLGLIYIPAGHDAWMVVILGAIGFFVYCPQLLVAVAAADYATTEAAATAVGLTGLFGYIGATVCGYLTGLLVTHYGWDGGFWFWIASAVVGAILFATTWKQRSPMLDKIHG